MTEARETTVSKLAPNRYVPYNFKGLRPDQIDKIMSERDKQVVDNGTNQRSDKDEEYSWAVQNLANTQHVLNNELELQNKNKAMLAATRDHNLKEKDAKDARWPNMYGDLDAIPAVTKDMDANANRRGFK